MKFPEDVGILALECVFPSQYVDQKELETFDGVAPGKYTIGLSQGKMGFCTDIEDINSLCLTAVNNLMERHSVDYRSIGRMEVGTETIVDKSKSIKTVLMQLFVESGNMDVEGVDSTNACYGGTAALFNSIAWVESSAWDNRNALVVMGDIAVYSKGNARPTGGAGAIAMLVGPNAPLVLDRGNRATYMRHAYDFYKPDLSSEYPVVDGKLSIQCYLGALDQCYQLFCKKSVAKGSFGKGCERITLKNLDAVLFHTPYCKLVQKSLARLLLNDFKRATESEISEYPGLEAFRDTALEDVYFNRDVEKACMQLSANVFEEKTKPSLLLANQIGNMYTPSLYGGLVSLLINESPSQLKGKHVGLFSYGSGLASTMFSLRISENAQAGSPLVKLCENLAEVHLRLAARRKSPPEEFVQMMESREKTHHLAPYQPKTSHETLFPGTWFLKSIDDMHRREYDRIPSLIMQKNSVNSVLSSNSS